jgi:Zinc-binding dehydrogenase
MQMIENKVALMGGTSGIGKATSIEAGILHFQIAKTFSVQQVADAHEAQDSGETIGKIVIEIARAACEYLAGGAHLGKVIITDENP